jgi:3-hydroxyisobutyrate dehydrogenase-like beta-hydroxyacid dehydrogenase
MSARIALIGLGEVGGLIADELSGRAILSAYDIRFTDAASAPSAKARLGAIRAVANHADAARGADIVISAVTAAQTVAAAIAAAPGLAAGAWFFDLNSASPGAKGEAAEVVNAADGRYVEAAVMSPFAPKRRASPILLGGPHAEAFAPVARDLGFSGVSVFASAYGKASAAKLCRSVMVKGVEALLTESLLAARHYGVEDAVLASLNDLFPGSDWPRLSRYMISRAIEHGARRAEEMREAARTVEEAGVTPLLSSAIAELQDWASAFKPALAEASLAALLGAVRMQMDSERP